MVYYRHVDAVFRASLERTLEGRFGERVRIETDVKRPPSIFLLFAVKTDRPGQIARNVRLVEPAVDGATAMPGGLKRHAAQA